MAPKFGGGDKCEICKKTVYAQEKQEAGGRFYHKQCFKCSHCKMGLNLQNYAQAECILYCKNHYASEVVAKNSQVVSWTLMTSSPEPWWRHRSGGVTSRLLVTSFWMERREGCGCKQSSRCDGEFVCVRGEAQLSVSRVIWRCVSSALWRHSSHDLGHDLDWMNTQLTDEMTSTRLFLLTSSLWRHHLRPLTVMT